MRYTRLFADDSGESHFEDAELEGTVTSVIEGGRTARISGPFSATGVIFVAPPPKSGRADGGARWGMHTAPSRRWAVGLSGRVALTASDGERRELEPGQVFLIEDTTGRGHITEPLTDDVSFLMILAPD